MPNNTKATWKLGNAATRESSDLLRSNISKWSSFSLSFILSLGSSLRRRRLNNLDNNHLKNAGGTWEGLIFSRRLKARYWKKLINIRVIRNSFTEAEGKSSITNVWIFTNMFESGIYMVYSTNLVRFSNLAAYKRRMLMTKKSDREKEHSLISPFRFMHNVRFGPWGRLRTSIFITAYDRPDLPNEEYSRRNTFAKYPRCDSKRVLPSRGGTKTFTRAMFVKTWYRMKNKNKFRCEEWEFLRAIISAMI